MVKRVGALTELGGRKFVTTTNAEGPREENGQIVIIKGGRQIASLTPKERDFYDAAKAKLDSVRTEITELEMQQASNPNDIGIPERLATARKTLAQQTAAASYQIDPSVNAVDFTMKKDMKAADFEKLYKMDAGSLNGALRAEALRHASGFGAERGFFASVEDAVDNYGVTEFVNGVTVATGKDGKPLKDEDGKYVLDYSQAVLKGGERYSVAAENIGPKEEKSGNLFAAIFKAVFNA